MVKQKKVMPKMDLNSYSWDDFGMLNDVDFPTNIDKTLMIFTSGRASVSTPVKQRSENMVMSIFLDLLFFMVADFLHKCMMLVCYQGSIYFCSTSMDYNQ